MEILELLATIIISPIVIAIFLLPIIIPIIIFEYYNKKKNEQRRAQSNFSNFQQTTQNTFTSPYTINNFLLTSHEANFYKDLKPIADKYNLIIFCKLRMADILSVKPLIRGRDYYYWFQRISQKHIDFVLCNKSFIPAILIEIDDYTHDRADRQESDNFKNSVFKDTHIKLLRFRSWTKEDIEQEIKTHLFSYNNTQNQR